MKSYNGIYKDYVILYSHGNAEDLGQMIPLYNRIKEEFGISIASYDYLGYGPSKGHELPSEHDCYLDIKAAYSYLRGELKFDPDKIILFGRSLGSGPTVHLAKTLSLEGVRRIVSSTKTATSTSTETIIDQDEEKTGHFAGMILQSPLLSAVGTISNMLRYVVSDMFQNDTKIADILRPIVIMHGTSDRVVPPVASEVLTNILRTADSNVDLPRLVDFISIEDAGHNDIELLHWQEYRVSILNLLTHLSTHEEHYSDFFWHNS